MLEPLTGFFRPRQRRRTIINRVFSPPAKPSPNPIQTLIPPHLRSIFQKPLTLDYRAGSICITYIKSSRSQLLPELRLTLVLHTMKQTMDPWKRDATYVY